MEIPKTKSGRRLKAEQGIAQLEEPAINQAAGDFAINLGGEKNAGKGSKPNALDEPE